MPSILTQKHGIFVVVLLFMGGREGFTVVVFFDLQPAFAADICKTHKKVPYAHDLHDNILRALYLRKRRQNYLFSTSLKNIPCIDD